jgi:hypothetical protein
MSTALKAESPCRKSLLLSWRQSSLCYFFVILFVNKSQNTYSHMMLNKYGDVNSHLDSKSIDYLYIVHCTLCSLCMNRWPVNSRNNGLVRISTIVTIIHASTNTGESYAMYGKKFRFLTKFVINYSIMVKLDKNWRKYDCKGAIFVIHYSTYCLIPEHNPLESITKNIIFFMNDNGIQFPQNFVYIYIYSLGYESVDRSTFSCWKCSSINAFIPHWNFKRMHSILIIIFKSHQNVIWLNFSLWNLFVLDYLLLEITTPFIVYIWRRHGGTFKFGFEFHLDMKHHFYNHVTTS